MTLSDLLPQIITAAATLIAVALTLFFTGRRETTRLAQQLDFEREKILADDRRDLFVRTAHALQRMKERLNGRDIEVNQYGWDAWEEAITKHADTLFELETELRLLAPSLTNAVRAATNAARHIRDGSFKSNSEHELLEEFQSHTMTAMDQMRSMLGTEPADVTELTPAEQAKKQGLI